jgi:hypothetical protein
MPLQQWHSRLGTPTVDLEERTRNSKGTGEYTATITPADVQVCSLTDDAYAAYLSYFKAMRGLIISSDDTDMDGSYTRFPEKALRIAMLLASLENKGRIELRHWARGQQIAEEWRANLHNLIDQLAGQSAQSKASILEDKMVQKIIHLGGATINDLRRHIRGISTDEAARVLDSLVQAGSLAFTANSKGTKKYYVPEGDEPSVDTVDTVDSRQQQNMSTIDTDQSQKANGRHNSALSTMSTVYDVYDAPAKSGTIACICGAQRAWDGERWQPCTNCQPQGEAPVDLNKPSSRYSGDAATIIGHDAVMGHWERPVRKWTVGDVEPYAQYPVSVFMTFIEPGKRKRAAFTVVPDNIKYLTVEAGGDVLYDSRWDVPCDMDQWATTNAKFTKNRGITIHREQAL